MIFGTKHLRRDNVNKTKTTVKKLEIFAIATDPIYVGTGGYTIGRVDNTIVRDPITKIPKIPGSAFAGTWRYYTALKLQAYFDDKKIFIKDAPDWVKEFEENKYARIECAGQDDKPNLSIDESKNDVSGHCGHCIVCKAFGFSKKDRSWQGLLFFSDLNIVFFPVYTRLGVKWLTSHILLEQIGVFESVESEKIKTKEGNEQWLNLGWLNLEVDKKHNHNIKETELPVEFKNFVKPENIVVVPDSLISQIINSNLEVRTSVSIDPITGAAKEGALFTSEAIPRGTVLYGEVRIFNKFTVPNYGQIKKALYDSKHFYDILGIGGMTTRGFGRLKIEINEVKEKKKGGQQDGEKE